jgi:RNA polymerase sigma-70 factor (ECF subfamily)
LTPYPDHGSRSGSGPDDPRTPHGRYEQREAVELAFVAALQHLPGNQRAALLLFDVLGFSAREIATTMGTSTGSVTSALQRARATLAERAGEPDGQPALRRTGDARVRELVTGFATALEQGDAAALVALLTEDVTWSMPPMPHWYRGRRAVRDFVVEVPTARCGSWRTLATSANGQPALACYLATGPAGPHLPWSITVLSPRDEHIGEVTSFVDAPLFARFGLPAQLP